MKPLIFIEKLVHAEVLRGVNTTTLKSGVVSGQTLNDAYRSEHSQSRTQIFSVKMLNIFSFVSVHLVRHKIGVEHFVQSRRVDRGGNVKDNRFTLIDHEMIINAQALINIMRKRLCYKASVETRELCENIKMTIKDVDKDLHRYLVPECVYRNGLCPEPKGCRMSEVFLENDYTYYKELFI